MTALRDLAHARAGDKGNTSILSVFPFDDSDFELLREHLSVERVRAHLGEQVLGTVVRHELPLLCALQFVCQQALDGGVTTSLALDTHGKGLSSRLLAIDLPEAGRPRVGA